MYVCAGTLSIFSTISAMFPGIHVVRTKHAHAHHPWISQTFVRLPNAPGWEDVSSAAHVSLIVDALLGGSDWVPDRNTCAGTTGQWTSVVVGTDSATSLRGLGKAHPEKLPDVLILPGDGVSQSSASGSTIASAIVFVNTVVAATKLHAALIQHPRIQEAAASLSRTHGVHASAGDLVRLYHRKIAAREPIPVPFADGFPLLIVSTDILARGYNNANITHVIQAEFAENVVSYVVGLSVQYIFPASVMFSVSCFTAPSRTNS